MNAVCICLQFQRYILMRIYYAVATRWPYLRSRATSYCHVTVVNRKCAVSLTTGATSG